ncbi:DUF3892 domain-containing protein [Streptomyces sp. RK23]|uniref:DUF3892 domain-containing protein n=1 Tax=unclassified Streptomyces TaxID=2593676 RepID=UPI001B36CC2D|nr:MULTISPECIES: DUF3892 domain-containing protein [unclassified Streptomyces]MBQ0969247.1 DUF3892 domain-containing protein [Streptomyces sp. RK74B]MBQ1009225.1 DUF3892 domain-containing protein [Streptomyces sp. RK23]
MAIQITAVRLSGGTTHQHITRLWWTNPATAKTGDNTRAEIVTWIEDTWIEDEKGQAYTSDAGGHRAEVAVVTPPRGEKYLQTRADGVWTNNLLALPRR